MPTQFMWFLFVAAVFYGVLFNWVLQEPLF